MSLDSSRSGSANSSRRSKRSLNNSSSSKNSKNSKQKTLGMAWGANSLSSSRSSFRNSPFSDFGSYMALKNQKLQDQFNAEASCSSHSGSSSGKPIFHGVSIFVDGFTIPSSQELRGYMLKYGGRFENYFSRHSVTHIICSNLADTKIKNLRSFSGGLPVVKPAWILDSVVANKLLSWVPYQLDQLAGNQPKLSAFFALKSSPVSEGTLTAAVCQVNLDPSLKGDISKDANLSEVVEPMKHGNQMDEKFVDPELEEPNTGSEKSSEVRMSDPSASDRDDGNNVKNEPQSGPRQLSSSVSSYCLDDQNMKGSPSSEIVGTSRRHSTLEDPNFVENYFKSSRLHFIGTWRNRYCKRFRSLSSEFKHRSSDLNASDSSQKTNIIHIDMDCFFVSVVIRNHPELHDKPVAVCHSDNPKGTAEISSANYPARNYGVKAGIFVRDAKARCPHLIIFPYNFQAYEEVADQFYNILHKRCNKVQAVSCDEAFLDITDSERGDPELLASAIRKEIFETTGCTASAGIAGNMLMARLATRTAKPNGQCYIPSERVDEYLHQLPIKALPGIGYVLEEKLKKQNIWTCGQLRLISKDSLQKDFGMKTGEMLWNYCRGIDNRLVGVIQESKSIGAEVNWGVRFKDLQDSRHFLLNLCKEVSLRLQGCGVQGRTFTLKIKKRRKDAEEPTKYMGCGDCENLSHSITVPIATDDVEVLQRITKQLFGSFCLDVKDIRGVGLQVCKLENADSSKQGVERNSLRSWLTSASASTGEQCKINSITKERANMDSEVQIVNGTLGKLFPGQIGFSAQMDYKLSTGEACFNSGPGPPPLCNLDMEVVESLPPELFSELNEIYGGKLADFIAKRKGTTKNISSSSCITAHEQVAGAVNDSEGPHTSDTVPLNTILVENKVVQTTEEAHSAPVSGAQSPSEAIQTVGLGNTDLMPSSLSQVDASVLQQLPEELRVDILGLLPAHRRPESTSNAALESLTENLLQSSDIKTTENQSMLIDSVLSDNLWIGNPPHWVDKFEVSNCLILKTMAKMYYKLESTGSLSLILQRALSEHLHPLDESSNGWGDEATYHLCELLKQYIKLKIELDIEEIYVCFRILKRFTTKSKFFLQVYDMVFPYLQVIKLGKASPESLNIMEIQVAILGALHCYPAVSVGLMGNVLQKPHLKGKVVVGTDVWHTHNHTVLSSKLAKDVAEFLG